MTARPRWVEYLLEHLVPQIGGVPTFCEDPDGLLDLPEAREALRGAGMTIGDWDGLPASLVRLKNVPDGDKPLLVVDADAPEHVVQSCLHHQRWTRVSIAEMFPKLAQEVVREVPPAHWDQLFALCDELRAPRSAHETALLVARALYGLDPEYLEHGNGWLCALIRLAAGDEPPPRRIARAVVGSVPAPPYFGDSPVEVLSSTPAARAVLTAALRQQPALRQQGSPSDQALVRQLEGAIPAPKPVEDTPDLLSLWDQAQSSQQSVLEFGLAYAEAVAREKVALATRQELNRRFTDWIVTNYGLVQSSVNDAVIRLPKLVDKLNDEAGAGRLLLVVVDALGLEAWIAAKARWQADGIIGAAKTRVALAVLPTVTSLSRRAIFEGKPPAQFGSEKHSQRLERKLWTARFGDDSGYFTVDEEHGFRDALDTGKSRICLLDVTWDKRGHSIDPRTDSITDAARVWAGRTPLRSLIQAALAYSYRVFITADHGQVACVGQERLQAGVLVEERSKRVQLFTDKTVVQHYAKPWTYSFKPAGSAPDCFPLFVRDFGSFDSPGVPTVSHGGITIEEALVPVAEVTG